jgi:hypothetical protein
MGNVSTVEIQGPSSKRGLDKLMSLASLGAGIYTGNPAMITGGSAGLVGQAKGEQSISPLGNDSALKRRLERIYGQDI